MDTKELIIKSAIELFTEHGVDSVSIRDVTKNADLNIAAVNYHFGSKEILIKEVAATILDPISLRRIKLLTELIEKNGSVEATSLHDIFYVLFSPLLCPENPITTHGLLAKLTAYYTSHKGASLKDTSNRIYRDLLVSYVKVLYIKLPHLSVEEIRQKFVFATGAALHHIILAPTVAALTNEVDQSTPEEVLSNLISFSLNGFDNKGEKTQN